MKLGQHTIIGMRLEGDQVIFTCENEIICEVTLPSQVIQIAPDDAKEYLLLNNIGVSSIFVHYSNFCIISTFANEVYTKAG